MYGLVLIRYRRPLDEVVAATEPHRAYLRELQSRRVLIAAGPFDPRTGGALLVRLPDATAAAALDAIRNGDPFYRDGIANYELIAWKPVLGVEGLDSL